MARPGRAIRNRGVIAARFLQNEPGPREHSTAVRPRYIFKRRIQAFGKLGDSSRFGVKPDSSGPDHPATEAAAAQQRGEIEKIATNPATV